MDFAPWGAKSDARYPTRQGSGRVLQRLLSCKVHGGVGLDGVTSHLMPHRSLWTNNGITCDAARVMAKMPSPKILGSLGDGNSAVTLLCRSPRMAFLPLFQRRCPAHSRRGPGVVSHSDGLFTCQRVKRSRYIGVPTPAGVLLPLGGLAWSSM